MRWAARRLPWALALGIIANNGLVDIYNTTFSDDYNPLYRNDGDANFTDVSYQMGIADVTIPFLGWGTGFLDYDNDGWKDIVVANGHVYLQVDKNNWGTTYAQRPLLFHNELGKKFERGSGRERNRRWRRPIPGRGAAFGDLFNNGKIDVVINQYGWRPGLVANVSTDHNHWVGLQLKAAKRVRAMRWAQPSI